MIESDANERLEAAQLRLARITEAETRFQKLTAAFTKLPFSEKPDQLKLIRSGLAYLDRIDESRVQGIKGLTATVRNELSSLRDGIKTGGLTEADLHLQAAVKALNSVREMRAKAAGVIDILQAGIENQMLDRNEQLLLKNKQFKEKLPSFVNSEKEFAVARAPISFTFQNKQGHSSVGFVNTDMLGLAGFKVENLAGYTILHNQLVIGINVKATKKPALDKNGDALVDADGKAVLVDRTITEKVNKFKAGKPITVKQRRSMTTHDLALQVLDDLRQRTKQRYALVSDKPAVGHNGGIWFWVMDPADIKRLAKSFPGGHIGIAKWGFAWGNN